MRSKLFALMILGSCFTALGSSTSACETCQAGHKKKGLLEGVNLLAAFHRTCDSCDHGPSCGCEHEPACGCEVKPECGCEAKPSCGCEQSCDSGSSGGLLNRLFKKKCSSCDVAPECGCEVVPPSCGCETDSCDGASCGGGMFKGGLLGKLFKKKSCDSGCTDGCEALPSCGCEQSPACGCEVATPSCGCATPGCDVAMGTSCEPLLTRLFRKKTPSCGCESFAACDCDVTYQICDVPAACDDGCDSGGSSGGLLSKLFKKSSCSTCDTGCDVPAPACGCEVQPECGCETVPSCGCESGCDTACSSNSGGLLNRLMSKLHGSSACGCSEVPSCGCEVEPACGCEAKPSCGCESGCATHAIPMPIKPIESDEPPPIPSTLHKSSDAVNMDPMPAPPPPNKVPDAEQNPFQDDNVNRLHKVPAKTIQYQKPGSYGRDYDPQARSGVRVKFSDLVQKPVEAAVKPASYYEPARLPAAPTVKRLKRVPQQP